jgi:hypothetical protein
MVTDCADVLVSTLFSNTIHMFFYQRVKYQVPYRTHANKERQNFKSLMRNQNEVGDVA